MNNPLALAKNTICLALTKCIQSVFKVQIAPDKLIDCVENAKSNNCELSVHFFRFSKQFKQKPVESAELLNTALVEQLKNGKGNLAKTVQKTVLNGPYINFYIQSTFWAPEILKSLQSKETQNYFSARIKPKETRRRIMVEYSSPNTHKAFHVGHMRNASLGDTLVRILRHLGDELLAVNYFGDEGAHVAKCLWLLRKIIPIEKLEKISNQRRGEFLGAVYSKSVEMLDVCAYTCLPLFGAVTAKVLEKTAHPDQPKWNVVKVTTGENEYQVICNGTNYSVGDIVAYMPVGKRLKGKILEKKVMKDVESNGLILGETEIPDAPIFRFTDSKKQRENAEKLKFKSKKSVKKAAKNIKEAKIYVFPENTAIGQNLTELGRLDQNSIEILKKLKSREIEYVKKSELTQNGDFFKAEIFSRQTGVIFDSKRDVYFFKEFSVDTAIFEFADKFEITDFIKKNETIEEYLTRLKNEVSCTLSAMESLEPEITKLWEKTKKWSLDEFKRIYDWVGCGFDHDFCESEMSRDSKALVKKYYEKGVFVKDDGCIGADLSKFGLGFCILQKTDGNCLYATKDVQLAHIKFDVFNVDRSILVVDASQTHHFKQVFGTLDLMGYEKTKDYIHLGYALVNLPNGKMSSRKGTVIVFSDLVRNLKNNLKTRCFSKEKIQSNPSYWTEENVEKALHAISVGTIRYGMLNQDVGREIIFNLDEWANPNGNTGSYLMYQYTRIASILREVENLEGESVPEWLFEVLPEHFEFLQHRLDRFLLFSCFRFWEVVETSAQKSNPMLICTYLYELCKGFSSWYNVPEMNIKRLQNEQQKRVRLCQILFLKKCLQTGLKLLGIDVLERM